METEYEAKFYPVNKTKIRQRLKALGAKLVLPERKMRRSVFDCLFNPQIKAHYIRVRDEGNTVRMSLKIHAEQAGRLDDQKELDIEVSSFDRAVAILESLSLKQSGYQENLRETWHYQGGEIEIDTWPGLKPYVEIEAKSEKKLKETAQKLKLDWEKRIITSVVEIYMKVYNQSAEKILKKLFFITFEKNPFKKNA